MEGRENYENRLSDKKVYQPGRAGREARRASAVSMAAAGRCRRIAWKHYTGDTAREFQGSVTCFPAEYPHEASGCPSHTCIATFQCAFSGLRYNPISTDRPSIFRSLLRLLRPDVRVVATFHSRDPFPSKVEWIRETLSSLCGMGYLPSTRTNHHYFQDARGLCDANVSPVFAMIPNGADVHISENTDLIRTFGLKEDDTFVGPAVSATQRDTLSHQGLPGTQDRHPGASW